MPIADVDWEAIGAVATGTAAVVTAILAAYTAKMASATKAMAEATKAQLELSRRQATAAEASVEQTERTMGATLEPRVRVLRITGEQAVVSLDDSGFSVMLVNEGPVNATINEARLNLPPQFVFLDPVPAGAIEPGDQRLLRCDTSPLLLKHSEFPVRIEYVGQTAKLIYTSFTLRRKGEGNDERWLVTEPESDKVHGWDRAQW